MPSARVLETFVFGGCDARSNPLAFPPSRSLRCVNFCPQPSQYLKLRYGYSVPVIAGTTISEAIHTAFYFESVNQVSPGGNPEKQMVYVGAGKSLYQITIGAGGNTCTQISTLTGPPGATVNLDGYPFDAFIADNQAFFCDGTSQLMTNGTDTRPSGIRAPTAAEGSGVQVNWTAAPTGSPTNSPSTATQTHRENDWVGLGNLNAQDGAYATAVLYGTTGANQSSILQVTGFGFAIPANSTIQGVEVEVWREQTAGTSAVYDDLVQLLGVGVSNDHSSTTPWAPAGAPSGELTVTYGSNIDTWGATLTASSINSSAFGVQLGCECTGAAGGGTGADIGIDYVAVTVFWSAASAISPWGPTTATGYQFAMAYYNPITGHVGNFEDIGPRLTMTATASQVAISGLPNLSTVNTEWVKLLGRTYDGTTIPYALDDPISGDWVVVGNTQTVATLTASSIDWTSPLPTRNGLPPSSHACCYALGRAYWIDDADPHLLDYSEAETDLYGAGSFVGQPPQSFAPLSQIPFPKNETLRGVHEFGDEVWAQTRTFLGIVTELGNYSPDGVPSPQYRGIWVGGGICGQRAFIKTPYGPYWVTPERELMTWQINGPIQASTEYQAALLAQLGTQYLTSVELAYLRDPERDIDRLYITGLDDNASPIFIVHDFLIPPSGVGEGYQYEYTGICPTVFVRQPDDVISMRDATQRWRLWVASGCSGGGGGGGRVVQRDVVTDPIANCIAIPMPSAGHTSLDSTGWWNGMDDTTPFVVDPYGPYIFAETWYAGPLPDNAYLYQLSRINTDTNVCDTTIALPTDPTYSLQLTWLITDATYVYGVMDRGDGASWVIKWDKNLNLITQSAHFSFGTGNSHPGVTGLKISNAYLALVGGQMTHSADHCNVLALNLSDLSVYMPMTAVGNLNHLFSLGLASSGLGVSRGLDMIVDNLNYLWLMGPDPTVAWQVIIGTTASITEHDNFISDAQGISGTSEPLLDMQYRAWIRDMHENSVVLGFIHRASSTYPTATNEYRKVSLDTPGVLYATTSSSNLAYQSNPYWAALGNAPSWQQEGLADGSGFIMLSNLTTGVLTGTPLSIQLLDANLSLTDVSSVFEPSGGGTVSGQDAPVMSPPGACSSYTNPDLFWDQKNQCWWGLEVPVTLNPSAYDYGVPTKWVRFTPTLCPVTVFSDNFNRPDQPLSDPNWNTIAFSPGSRPLGTLAISGNQLVATETAGTSATQNYMFYSQPLPIDQWVQVTNETGGSTNSSVTLELRIDASTNNSWEFQFDPGTNYWSAYDACGTCFVDTSSPGASAPATNIAPGDVLYVGVQGSIFTVKINGVALYQGPMLRQAGNPPPNPVLPSGEWSCGALGVPSYQNSGSAQGTITPAASTTQSANMSFVVCGFCVVVVVMANCSTAGTTLAVTLTDSQGNTYTAGSVIGGHLNKAVAFTAQAANSGALTVTAHMTATGGTISAWAIYVAAYDGLGNLGASIAGASSTATSGTITGTITPTYTKGLIVTAALVTGPSAATVSVSGGSPMNVRQHTSTPGPVAMLAGEYLTYWYGIPLGPYTGSVAYSGVTGTQGEADIFEFEVAPSNLPLFYTGMSFTLHNASVDDFSCGTWEPCGAPAPPTAAGQFYQLEDGSISDGGASPSARNGASGAPYTGDYITLLNTGVEEPVFAGMEITGDPNVVVQGAFDDLGLTTAQIEALASSTVTMLDTKTSRMRVEFDQGAQFALLRLQLTAHPADGYSLDSGKPPNIPVQFPGRIYVTRPEFGRGRGVGGMRP